MITGQVIDASTGEPVIGASVIEKGTTNGTVTDLDGRFSLSVRRRATVEIHSISYKTKTIDVSSATEILVQLESDNELEESVVVGAGSQKKISITGAITSVAGRELASASSSLTSGLAGKLAGVISMTSSGEPGSTTDFYIRGVGTFGGRATPLILLDDVEISSGDLNRIPAETIESFTILKDASATAIYGVRGANGVMLITTKKGQENTRAKVGVTVENSFVQPMRFPQFVDGATWMELYNEGLLARGTATPKYSQEQIDMTRSHVAPYIYPDVDWQKVLFRNFNMNQRANINISGGGNRATYYMSLNVNHDSGILNAPRDYYFNNNINNWSYNFQNNISYKLSKSTTVDLHLNAQIGSTGGPGEGASALFNNMLYANPVQFPAWYPSMPGDTHIRFGNASYKANELYNNPYAYMLDDHAQYNYTTLNVSLKLDQKLDFITKGLAVQGLVNWKSYANKVYRQGLTPNYYTVTPNSWSPDNPNWFETQTVGVTGDEYVWEDWTNGNDPNSDQTFYFDARLTYNRSFKRHNVGALLMYMMREFRPGRDTSNKYKERMQRNQGLSGRVTYDFDHRYFAEFNFGYNGTERLPEGDRFEFFPAVSLGWAISSEKFWEPVSRYVDFFKVRASYGLVGSDGFDDANGTRHFVYFDQIRIGSGGWYSFGPSVGESYRFQSIAVDGYASSNVHWERVKKLDIGLDLSLFRQINITFDYFKDKRDRIMMMRANWPEIFGYYNAVPWGQVGKAENEGFDLSVNWHKDFGKDWTIELRGSYTYNRNKFVDKDEPNYTYPWQYKQGKPLDGYRWDGYIADGLFTSEEEIANSPEQLLGSAPRVGDIKYRDLNGDGKITADDQTMISKYGTSPRSQYGMGLTLRWRRWDLGVFFNGSGNRTIMLNTPNITPFGEKNNNLLKFIADNRWTESNPDPDAQYPRLGVNDADIANNQVISTYWLRNGRFIRFKTLEVGWSFKYGRVYINGDNIAVWSPFKLWDPELNWNTYPLQRTFTLGLQLKF